MPYNRAMARLTPDERIVVRKFNRIHHEEMQKHLAELDKELEEQSKKVERIRTERLFKELLMS